MSCCAQCLGIEEQFNAKRARRELRRYQKKGPTQTTQILLDALEREGGAGGTLLDVGGGIGAIQHELAKAGAARLENVDASTGYLAVAREEAARRGYAERARYHHGDFVTLAPKINPADVVTLDRVLCCYPDCEALVAASAARAVRLYGLVYPRKTWLTRAGFRVINFMMRLTRSSFRGYLHAPEAVDAQVQALGFERRFIDETLFWLVAVYARPAGTQAA